LKWKQVFDFGFHRSRLQTLNWTRISDDPISRDVLQPVTNELKRLRRSRSGYLDWIDEFIAGRSVLDIGVVEHDISHIELPTWKHKYIRERAAHVLGIDIVPEGIDLLRSRGYKVRLADATSEDDLGERFERVLIGDVIEHVNSPLSLLQFASRHLTPDGLILVTTPNPYWIKHIWSTFVSGTLVTNADHISWISPSAALELGRRAGLPLREYWLMRLGKAAAKRALLDFVNCIVPDSELLASKFLYVYSRAVTSEES
jgi:2-polyprenyl-3-methyl-5-hydroxy-6-metoxy-1,4-benzoquinol methylase